MRKEKRKKIKKYVETMVFGEVQITTHRHYLIANITHLGVTIKCSIPTEFIVNDDEYIIAKHILYMYREKLFSTFIKRPQFREVS